MEYIAPKQKVKITITTVSQLYGQVSTASMGIYYVSLHNVSVHNVSAQKVSLYYVGAYTTLAYTT
jgi:hypothetical protein